MLFIQVCVVNISVIPLFYVKYCFGCSFVFCTFITTDLVNESSIETFLDALYIMAQFYHLQESNEFRIVMHGFIELRF